MKVAVIGAAGYAGGELLRLLLQHPDVSECIATSRSQAAKPIADVHPALGGLSDARFSGASAGEASRGRDVVFLCLEHGESSKIAGEVFDAGPGLVVDLAADFRVKDPRLYERFYGPHTAPELVSRFTYGLADVRGKDLRGATAIAAPGCFATAAQLALYPLARAGLDVSPSLFGITGSSGAGVHPRPTTHHPMRAHNVFAYSPLGHRHEAEVLQTWREWIGRPDATCRMMTHSGPFVRGIYLTLHAYLPRELALSAGDPGTAAAGWYREAYRDRPFVRVLDAPPELTHAVGTNSRSCTPSRAPTAVRSRPAWRSTTSSRAPVGQAIQAMNLALGLDERAGLMRAGIYPC